MTTTVMTDSIQSATRSRLAGLPFRLLAGIPLALGAMLSFLGLAYDVQWHSTVGPDTFFTLPHLVLYSGVGLAGLSCLLVVLYSTHTYRAGRSIFPVASLSAVLGGRFWAPLGFVIGGFGSLSFLLFGLYDEWWHSIYGFDVTIFSPPHVGLLFSVLINMVGCILVYGGADRNKQGRATLGAVVGLTAAVATLLGILTVFIGLLELLPFVPDPHQLGMALFITLGFLLVIATTRQPGAATLVALWFTGLRTVIWYVAPWATSAYAAYLGLHLRDYADLRAEVALAMPIWTIGAALVVDALCWVARRRNWSLLMTVAGAGGVAALVLVLPQQYIMGEFALLAPITPLVALVVGALMAWIGWNLGTVLRRIG
ncbi:MAG: hypothetical protein ACOYNY_00985 [Caldilineaceae bacterium]